MKLTVNQNTPVLQRIEKELPKLFKDLLAEVGELVTKETKDNLSGRVLQSHSGKLRDSVGFELHSLNTQWQMKVGTIRDDVRYDEIHEKGLPGRSRNGKSFRMPKRSYLMRAYQSSRDSIKSLLKGLLYDLSKVGK